MIAILDAGTLGRVPKADQDANRSGRSPPVVTVCREIHSAPAMPGMNPGPERVFPQLPTLEHCGRG